jgi:hypothetical protein
MKARPPFGGFAFFSASQISHKAELMPVVRKSSAYGFRGAWRGRRIPLKAEFVEFYRSTISKI